MNAPKVYSNGAAQWWCSRPRQWLVQPLNPAGKPFAYAHTCGSRQAAERAAESIARRAEREAAVLPPAYGDWTGPEGHMHNALRPSRTPYFYRKQAIIWAREARCPWGLLRENGGALRLAKSYLASYQKALAAWKERFGV